VCGGAVEVFVEPLTVPTCLLLGAGHLATAVAPVAAVAGFRVLVADDRATHANAERFPEAAECLVRPFPALLRELAPRLGPGSWCVIVTRSHKLDEDCAAACLATPARYVGMIGSANKVERCRAALRERGLADEVIARLRAPVGLDLGAQTHGEIAVAIVAEMIAVRRGAAAPERAKAATPPVGVKAAPAAPARRARSGTGR
jgi:xanthine dehydrogenase accessory factor